MISDALRAEIRRLFYAEHWKVGTIASSLGVHPDTVRRAIESQRFGMHTARPRPSMLDPYLDFIRRTLESYPRLRATRLFEMLRQRGYPGSVVQLRRLVAKLRPRKTEAFLRRRTLPGEEAQADWGCFGPIEIGKAKRSLSCFVMVLSWSRAIHAVFTLDQTLESFLRGHRQAFDAFGGVARTVLYDNLRSAVLERKGEIIRFHPRLLELCAHYHFAPRPVAPARGNEKGRVERQIQYLRTSFFAARSFRDVDDLNAQFHQWREEIAHIRPVPGETLTVREALEQERCYLLPLPAHPFETDLVRAVRTGKTPYVQFDRNLYSVPHKLVRQPLTLVASDTTVRILDAGREVARHVRSYDSQQCIEDPAHIEALVKAKRNARPITSRDRLLTCVPQTKILLEAIALRGEPLGYHTTRLLRLLDDYGTEEMRRAVGRACERQAYSAGSVAHILEQRRRKKGQPPPLPMPLPRDPRVRDLRISSHSLEDYDALGKSEDDDESGQPA